MHPNLRFGLKVLGGILLAGLLAAGGVFSWKLMAMRSHYAAMNSIYADFDQLAKQPPPGFTAAQWHTAFGLLRTAVANNLLQHQAKSEDVKALAEAMQHDPLRAELHTPEGLFKMMDRLKAITRDRGDRIDGMRWFMRDTLGADDPNVPSKWEKP
ncbi:MAG: hypothetical protein PSW75_11840 [bacterium]|nr:hypothetical protein [bacterium]MDI1335734.1 hypothetical protein [Lacunisphaera sp.]